MSSRPHPSPLEGERLTLTCQANEASKEIRWTKDDTPVNTRANIFPFGNNSTLVIEKVLTSDSVDIPAWQSTRQALHHLLLISQSQVIRIVDIRLSSDSVELNHFTYKWLRVEVVERLRSLLIH